MDVYDVWLFECDFDAELLVPQEGEVEKIEKHSIDEVKKFLDEGNFTDITAEFVEKIEKNIKK